MVISAVKMRIITENNLCRICLNKDENNQNDICLLKIFETSAIEVLQYLFGINIDTSTLDYANVPRKICNKCQDNVSNAMLLTKLALESHDIIGSIDLQETIDVKEEPELIIEDILQPQEVKIEDASDEYSFEQYSCAHCSSQFSGKTDLVNHIQTHLTPPSKRMKKFSKKPLNAKHPNQEKIYKCNHCSQTFYQLIDMKIHLGEKVFKCEICSKSFTTSSNLKTHIRIHSGEKPFACVHCSSSFTMSSALRRHLKVHTGEKPFKCNSCPRSFIQSSDLKNHIRIHSGEKPYKCGHCSKSFNQSSALKSHLRTHSGEKPFKCEVCCKSFTTSSNLRKHLQNHNEEKVV